MAARIATHIPGFDKLINGGFIEGTTNLISGGTGTCKSIFCIQFLCNRILKDKEKVAFITTEDGVESIHIQAEKFGWDITKGELKQKFKIYKLEPYNINKFVSMIETIKKSGIKRLVIDSMSVFEIYVKEPFNMRKNLFNIIELLRHGNMVTIMTVERPEGYAGLSRSDIVEFMADSVILLQYIQAAKIKRSLIVRKMRFTPHSENAHPFTITKKGLVIG
jgi:KaiC/GvpD/RAD55 family RecA-like ATPase